MMTDMLVDRLGQRSLWSSRARIVLFFLFLLLAPFHVRAQYATAPGYTAGTVGGACNNSTQNFAWPDASGHFLQCVSSLWATAGQPGTAAGSTGYVQYNNSGAMGGASNLFWSNASGFLGIGTSTAANALDVNGALVLGTYVGKTEPSNSVLISGTLGVGSASPASNLDVNGSLVIGAAFGTSLTTLTGAITATQTTIPVVSTANYPSSGAIGIVQEEILYTGKTATSFTGCTRGAYSTTATARGSGTAVNGILVQFAPTSGGPADVTVFFRVMNNQGVSVGNLQYQAEWQGIGTSRASALCIGSVNCNVGSNSLGLSAACANTPVGQCQNAFAPIGGATYGNNSQGLGRGNKAPAFAEMQLGDTGAVTGSETGTSWTGTDPTLSIGLAAGSNALMVFQNGQMLVNGQTILAVPVGTASLTPMGISTTSSDAALNATDSSKNSKLYIRDDGNVGIGNVGPAYLLHVGSSSASGIVAEFQNSSGTCTLQPGASGMLTTCSSDARLKDDIHDTGDALAWLADMRVRDFTIKATGEPRTGVIAQEMLETHPDMVKLGPDGFYGVEDPNPWLLVRALHELKAAHDRLRRKHEVLKAEAAYEIAQIKALRARIDELEALH